MVQKTTEYIRSNEKNPYQIENAAQIAVDAVRQAEKELKFGA